jgi:hypothetical protein
MVGRMEMVFLATAGADSECRLAAYPNTTVENARFKDWGEVFGYAKIGSHRTASSTIQSLYFRTFEE